MGWEEAQQGKEQADLPFSSARMWRPLCVQHGQPCPDQLSAPHTLVLVGAHLLFPKQTFFFSNCGIVTAQSPANRGS